MWRGGKEIVMFPKIGFLLSHGALGDTITSLPALVYARKSHHPAMEMIVYTRNDLVPLVEMLLPRQGLRVVPLEVFHDERERNGGKLTFPFSMNSSPTNTLTRNKCDMVDFAFHCLLDTSPPSRESRDYPTAPLGPKIIDGDYAVISPNGTAPNRILTPAVVTALCQWLIERGIKPVFLGKSDSAVPVVVDEKRAAKTAKATSRLDEIGSVMMDRCYDLRDKTSILEARDICGHAKVVIGIDGGLLHLAGTTDVPILYACTSVDPIHRGVQRHGQVNWNVRFVTPNLECGGCQSHWTLVFGHPFTTCMYNDYACVDLNPQDFTEALDALIKGDKRS